MIDFYLLDVDKVVPTDMQTWAKMYQGGKQRLWWDWIRTRRRLLRVSTVFLGMDHGFWDHVLLFETMIFVSEGAALRDEYQIRCGTYAEAIRMHREGVAFAVENL